MDTTKLVIEILISLLGIIGAAYAAYNGIKKSIRDEINNLKELIAEKILALRRDIDELSVKQNKHNDIVAKTYLNEASLKSLHKRLDKIEARTK
jgi:hypothetical protein